MFLVCRAPLRLDLAGGWTDVSPYAAECGGFVLNASITRYAYASVKTRRRGRGITLTSSDYHVAESFPHGESIQPLGLLGLPKAILKHFPVQNSLDIFLRTEALPGAGLGSSAAMGVALIGLLSLLKGRLKDPKKRSERRSWRFSNKFRFSLAEEAFRIETEDLKNSGGKQDQYAAALGGFHLLEFLGSRVRAFPLSFPASVLPALEKRLLLVYTGKSRISGRLIDRVMQSYRLKKRNTVQGLHGLRKIPLEMKSALTTGDMDRVGKLLLENWQCQKMLHPTISNPKIDSLFQIALERGALGGKALGAGGGGCLLFLCPRSRVEEIGKAIVERNGEILAFRFEKKGFHVVSQEY